MSNTSLVEKLSNKEKIKLMEELWSSLREPSVEYKLPKWHLSELESREKKIAHDELKFTDWDKAKKDINKTVK